jgi:hypothetical protein
VNGEAIYASTHRLGNPFLNTQVPIDNSNSEDQPRRLKGGSKGNGAAGSTLLSNLQRVPQCGGIHCGDWCHFEMASHDVSGWECSLCLRLLCDPATTVCGHSFCKTCIAMGMFFLLDSSSTRYVMPIFT